jgi:hypothetical protein
MRHVMRRSILALTFACLTIGADAAALDPALQAKVNARMQAIRAWAADPVVVRAVKDANAAAPAEESAMTQEKWAALSVLDPLVRGFTKNEAAALLKGKRTDEMAELFVSGARGTKVAFLTKPTNWSHKGMPKHEVPMSGKTWQGEPAMDESTGLQTIQVAVPVMDGGKPIGSLVVGLALSKLR